MEVLLQEAREAYDEEMVVELRSESTDDIDSNVARIVQWVENWKKDHGKKDEAETTSQQQQDGKGRRDEDDPMFLHG